MMVDSTSSFDHQFRTRAGCRALLAFCLVMYFVDLPGGAALRSNDSKVTTETKPRDLTTEPKLRRFPSPLNPNKRLAVIAKPAAAAGTKIWTHDPKDCIYISGTLLSKGEWEPHLQEALMEGMQPGGLFVDIGANIGTYSLIMATAGHDVVSFEPLPYNLELFRASIIDNRLWSKIRIFDVAVGDTPLDEVCLSPTGNPERNQGNGKISDKGDGELCIPLIRPDSVLSHCPDAIKVDVEGWEGPAMRGLGVADGKCRPNVIVHEYYPQMAKENPFDFLFNYYDCQEAGGVDHICKLKKNKQAVAK